MAHGCCRIFLFLFCELARNGSDGNVEWETFPDAFQIIPRETIWSLCSISPPRPEILNCEGRTLVSTQPLWYEEYIGKDYPFSEKLPSGRLKRY